MIEVGAYTQDESECKYPRAQAKAQPFTRPASTAPDCLVDVACAPQFEATHQIVDLQRPRVEPRWIPRVQKDDLRKPTGKPPPPVKTGHNSRGGPAAPTQSKTAARAVSYPVQIASRYFGDGSRSRRFESPSSISSVAGGSMEATRLAETR